MFYTMNLQDMNLKKKQKANFMNPKDTSTIPHKCDTHAPNCNP